MNFFSAIDNGIKNFFTNICETTPSPPSQPKKRKTYNNREHLEKGRDKKRQKITKDKQSDQNRKLIYIFDNKEDIALNITHLQTIKQKNARCGYHAARDALLTLTEIVLKNQHHPEKISQTLESNKELWEQKWFHHWADISKKGEEQLNAKIIEQLISKDEIKNLMQKIILEIDALDDQNLENFLSKIDVIDFYHFENGLHFKKEGDCSTKLLNSIHSCNPNANDVRTVIFRPKQYPHWMTVTFILNTKNQYINVFITDSLENQKLTEAKLHYIKQIIEIYIEKRYENLIIPSTEVFTLREKLMVGCQRIIEKNYNFKNDKTQLIRLLNKFRKAAKRAKEKQIIQEQLLVTLFKSIFERIKREVNKFPNSPEMQDFKNSQNFKHYADKIT